MPALKTFNTKQDAYRWMDEAVDDPCVDNYRFAFKDDDSNMKAYDAATQEGCCGFFDADIEIDGRAAIIGCNYGH